MVENFLLKIGMKCGTVKNFNSTILNDMRLNGKQHWYFLTPIKTSEDNTGLKTSIINLAFPFISITEDISEADVYKRLTPKISSYRNDLLSTIRKTLNKTQLIYFYPVAFWANEKGTERNERKDSGNSTIHIFNVQLSIKWRETDFNCEC